MAVETLSCPPSIIERGTTTRFTVSVRYSAADWTLAFVINNGTATPLSIAATTNADGRSFDVVISATQATALPLGVATWGESYTARVGGDIALGNTGTLNVLPGITGTGTPTQAQQNVTALEAAILKANGKQFVTVSFNGQSSTRFPLSEAQAQLVYWQSRVLKEQRDLAALRGNATGNEIGVVFGHQAGGFGVDYGRKW